jgi:hypothetical protein
MQRKILRNKCLLLESITGGGVSVGCRVKLKPRTKYLLTGWIRTEGVEPIKPYLIKEYRRTVIELQI